MSKFYVKTKVYIGKYDLSQSFDDIDRVFIVTDKFMVESGTINYVLDQFKNKKVQVFSEVTPDPDIDLVTRGLKIFNDFGANLLIAIGGGSPIDTAKAMLYFNNKIFDKNNKCKFIAIPTTSGTGSEVTKFSVISDKQKEVKYPLIDEDLLPDIAVLDSDLTLSVPPNVTAHTGLDVLTHAIEAYVSKNANDFTDALSEKAVYLVFNNLINTYKNPSCKESRQAMHNASCLAGMAFDNAGLGINHSIAHILGARLHLPHGLCNAIILPYIIEFNSGLIKGRNCELNGVAGKYDKLAKIFGINTSSKRQNILNFLKDIKKLCKTLDVSNNINDYDISKYNIKKEIAEIAEIAFSDSCTETNPINVNKHDIEKIIINILN
ncbi:MAG: 1-propanol dehydrogenase PduQ [Oscillospiraceae bacterium]